MLDETTQTNLAARLRRIEGQVKGIARMVEERRYCVDIATQISAVEGALRKVAQIVLRKHLETCVTEAFRSGDPAEQQRKVEELMSIYGKFGAV